MYDDDDGSDFSNDYIKLDLPKNNNGTPFDINLNVHQ
jgi:hypothetical protein